MNKFSIVCDHVSILGESPIWDEIYQRIYWVDIESKSLHAWSYIDNQKLEWNFDHRICAISLTKNNDILLCGFEKYFAFYNIKTKNVQKIQNQINLPKNVRFNDGKTDGFGRFWCGTMSEDSPSKADGAIYIVDKKLEIHKIFDGVHISNSLTSSPDNKYIYYADTFKKQIYKVDLSLDISKIKSAEVFVDNTNLKGFPDGSTTDINGHLWNAEWNGGQVIEYNLNGNIQNRIEVPMKKPTCCAFGGPNMDILFITSAMDNSSIKNDVSGKTISIHTKTKGNYSNRFVTK